ncbi:MAG: DUF885 domain-containing protein [Bryobacteraceae bacterium]|nr:DUF885 domain-containing protein [Bryobacteraceae bacterium]
MTYLILPLLLLAQTEREVTEDLRRGARRVTWRMDEPGHALAYKMGELKIKEMRRLAERELGERFDLRASHHAVLAHGSIPLAVLEAEIRRWIQGQK